MPRSLTILCLVAMLAGCTTSSAPPGITSNGVMYELPAESESISIEAAGVHFRNAAVDFHVTGRDVRLNGVPYGRLRRGDHVRLTFAGRLYVNGIERRATASPVPQ